MTENEISSLIVKSAIEVHKELGGPGLIESVYEESLIFEQKHHGLNVERQVSLPIQYKGNEIGTPLRLDLVIDRKVIIECKATAVHNEIFLAQLLTYLRLTKMKLGLLVNFGSKLVKDGIHRVVNGL